MLDQINRLQAVAPDLWVASTPHTWMGLHVGTRMTVVRLASGELWLHSPVPIGSALKQELDKLGTVRHIVCPNLFHHSYAGDAKALYPEAALYGLPDLRSKRPDLSFAADIMSTPAPAWQIELQPLPIEGCLLKETVFYHVASKTLITSDLVENFETSPHWWTRLYLRLAGLHGKIGWSRLLRVVYRDRAAARASIDRLLVWPFQRVVLAHGDIIEKDAHEAVRRAFLWL